LALGLELLTAAVTDYARSSSRALPQPPPPHNHLCAEWPVKAVEELRKAVTMNRNPALGRAIVSRALEYPVALAAMAAGARRAGWF
jgi:hypothetical protein